MDKALLAFEVSGRMDGWIRRLAAESDLSYQDTVRALLAPDRLARLEDARHPKTRPPLAQWGFTSGPWRRKVTVRIRLDRDHYERLRAVAEAHWATISDVARYLVTGGRTTEELDEQWRNPEPLEP